jgi:hypothetical protein
LQRKTIDSKESRDLRDHPGQEIENDEDVYAENRPKDILHNVLQAEELTGDN